jgi:K+-transporting ATPase KdpF subunit
MRKLAGAFLAVPTSLSDKQMQMEMNSKSWFALGIIIAFLLLVYLVLTLIKPKKF